MPIPILVSAGANLIGAGLKIGRGAGQQAQANELERRLGPRPDFNIQDEYFQNRNIAASQAQHGLNEDARNFQSTEAQRGLSSSLGATLQTGGGINAISSLNDSYNRAQLQTAAADSQLRAQNINNYMQQNSALAGQKTMKWTLDKLNPWLDGKASVQSMRSAGEKNVQTGIGEVAGTASAYQTATNYDDMVKMFEKSKAAPPAAGNTTTTATTDAPAQLSPAVMNYLQQIKYKGAVSTPQNPLFYDGENNTSVVPPNMSDAEWTQLFDFYHNH